MDKRTHSFNTVLFSTKNSFPAPSHLTSQFLPLFLGLFSLTMVPPLLHQRLPALDPSLQQVPSSMQTFWRTSPYHAHLIPTPAVCPSSAPTRTPLTSLNPVLFPSSPSHPLNPGAHLCLTPFSLRYQPCLFTSQLLPWVLLKLVSYYNSPVHLSHTASTSYTLALLSLQLFWFSNCPINVLSHACPFTPPFHYALITNSTWS